MRIQESKESKLERHGSWFGDRLIIPHVVPHLPLSMWYNCGTAVDGPAKSDQPQKGWLNAILKNGMFTIYQLVQDFATIPTQVLYTSIHLEALL